MIPLKKVEIIIESIQMNKVMRLLENCNLPGFTIIPEAAGSGLHGLRDAQEVTDVSKNTYIFTVCSDEQAQCLIKVITPLIKKCSGICFYSDVYKVASSRKDTKSTFI